MSSLFTRIVAGGPGRKTRFHTEQNELLAPGQYADLPIVAAQWLQRRIRPRLSSEPWWPRAVIPLIDRRLTRDARVLEFGAGASTLWLAKRAGYVLSIEQDAIWRDRIERALADAGLAHAHVLLRDGAAYHHPPEAAEESFDLVVVDGAWRWLCVDFALPRLAPGGLLYLDNADADKDLSLYPDPGARRLAQSALEDYARRTPGAEITRVKSLVTGELYAGEGWLLGRP